MNAVAEVSQSSTLFTIFFDPATGRPFQKNHCGSVLQHLTHQLPDGSFNIWFVSAASSVQQVANHSSASTTNPSPGFLALSELSSCPFPIYIHRQSVGDLLILPPSWYVLEMFTDKPLISCDSYSQNLKEGEGCSISWSRITLRSLELCIYQELPMYQRYSVPTLPHFPSSHSPQILPSGTI